MTIPRAAALSLLAFAMIAHAVAACSGETSSAADAGGCPQDLPKSCPTTPPSYAADVQAIFDRRCGGCHADGGFAVESHDLSNYAEVHRQRSAVLNQVYGCKMPPSKSAQPSPDERAKLLAWLVCGAPDN
jgi:hypothetical protein